MTRSITRVPELSGARVPIAAVLAALVLSACGRTPAGPRPLQFSVAGAAPRLLVASSETTVLLAVTNAGQREWDPARIHFSYHWLWAVPRELASRSRWNVPYQDGIRSELPHRVAPGARVDVPGRLLAPDWPGLYWLQWDMVEEGVAWFSQGAPRQPRTAVVVLPPMAWVVAPIPFLVALAGFIVTRRRRVSSRFGRALAPVADAAWCAAALGFKPLVVGAEALLEPTAAAYWLIVAAATLPPVLGLLLLPRRARAWTLVAVGMAGSIVAVADILYYRFFDDLLSAPALLAVRQTGHVWSSIRSLLSPWLLWMVADWPLAIGIAAGVARLDAPAPAFRHRARFAAAALAALTMAGVALSVPRRLSAITLEQTFRDRAVAEQLGLFGFHARDAWIYARSTVLRAAATEEEIGAAAAWLEARAPLRAGAGPLSGAARGHNLIVVQVESLQDFVVDFRIAGQAVMPHLKGWAADSLRFTNVTDETSEGRTSDAEFTALTSLLPLDHGAVAFRYAANHFSALPRVLGEHGYATLSAVPFEPGFWNRQVIHPAYGFQRSLFETDFQMTEQIGWGLNDRDFLQQMVPRLEQLPKPFAAWLITLSLHHPFDGFPDRHKELKLGALDRTALGNYLHAMRFFDGALESFRQALARDGLLDTSVVVVFGDHDAGFARDPSLSRTIGVGGDETAWALNDRVPLFVRVPHGAENPVLHGERATPAGQMDFAPTLLALLGIDASGLAYIGRNLLGAPAGPVPRPYGEWIDASHVFFTRSAAAACYERSGRRIAPDACAAEDREVRRAREVSRLILSADLQQTLRVQ